MYPRLRLPVDMSGNKASGDDILRWVEGKVKDGAIVGEGIGLQDVRLGAKQQQDESRERSVSLFTF